MQVVRLAHEADFAGWRRAARRLRGQGVAPEATLWRVDGGGPLPVPGDLSEDPGPAFGVPRAFMDLAGRVARHSSHDRFALLYRLLWRLRDEPGLMRVASDPDVARAERFAREVDRAAHRQETPNRRVVRAAVRASRDAPWDGQAATTLEEVAAGVDHCRRCDLWRDATQGVAGEGPKRARLLFVGEQPGDQEDLAGRPFVGPAGQLFDRALAETGVPRAETYVTNAVKHFKYELRGKRRIHKTPTVGEVAACRWWLDAERRIVRPRVIVTLGATAGLAVFGKPTPVGKARGQALSLPDQAQGVVTWHPSYLLRLPDEAARTKAYGMFVEDLRFAWKLAG